MREKLEKNEIHDLVKRAAAGSETAFSDLLDRYAPLINRSVASFRYCGMESEDLSQEAIIALLQAVRSFRPEAGVSFGLYAKICITNSLITAAKKRAASASVLSYEEERERSDEGANDPSVVLGEVERAESIMRSVRKELSAFENRVFDLYLAGYTAKETAALLSKQEKSISNALFRIRGKLKKTLS